MSSIDSRIVQLKFDNSGFESGVRTSLTSLDKLKAGLNFSSAKNGFSEIGRAAQALHLGPLSASIDAVNAKFLALSTVAVTAISSITTAVAGAGVQLAKSLTLDPIMGGLQEYETNMNSVQTILSNTRASGATLKDVTATLDELNEYSDQTIYNFAEMARNIGTFTAAGVGLEQSASAIKGIANLAAMSGSNSQQASTAMYQLSQAISAGKVSLADWNSVVNAGMGGTVFQRSLAETAVAMGVLDENALKLSGNMKNVTINGQSFRESISAAGGGESWLTSDVLTTALSTFTGDLNKAELAAIGFSKAQVKAIMDQAKTAQDAATKVKTLSQMIDVAKETAGSGWAQTWRLIFGDFNEARSTFTGLSNMTNGFIQGWADARNSVLEGWKSLGGREVLLKGIMNAFKALGSVITPIKDAFREIFPPQTASDLLRITAAFKDFFKNLKIGEDTANKIRRTFAGVFAVFDIAKQIIGGVVSAFSQLLSPLGEAGGGFLSLTAKIGDWLVSVDNALKNGEGLKNFFQNLGEIISAPIKFLVELGKAIANVFTNDGNIDAVGNAFGRVGDRLSVLEQIFNTLKEAWTNFIASLTASDNVFSKVVSWATEQFSGLGDAISEGLASGNFDKALDIINTGLFGGLLVIFKRFADNGASIFKVGFGDGVVETFKDMADGITGALRAMTSEIKANALLKIAGAIAILSVSLIALSLVDSNKLAQGVAGITVLFAELVASLAVLDSQLGVKSSLKLPLIGTGLILIAVGVTILANAVKKFGELDVWELVRGLGAIDVALGMFAITVNTMSNFEGSFIGLAISLYGVATALTKLADAVELYGSMDLGKLAKGFAGVTAGLIVMTRAMAAAPKKNTLETGAAFLLLSVSLNILANAVEKLGNLNLDTLAKGLGSVAAALVVMAGSMQAMPKDMMEKSFSLLLITAGILAISKAVTDLGKQDLESLGKGLGTIAVGLTAMVLALKFTGGEDALKSAGGIAIVAASMLILAPALAALGNLPIPVIATGLLALAAAFAVIGVAGLLLSEAIPGMLALGATLLMIGGAVGLVGLGVLALVKALEILVEIGKMAAETLMNAFNNLTQAIPSMMNFVTTFLVEMSKSIVKAAPEMGKAFVALINTFLDSIIKTAPKVKRALEAMIDLITTVVSNKTDEVVQAGITFLIKFANGLSKNMKPLVDAAAKVVTKFLYEMGQHAGEIAEATAQFIEDVIVGLTAAVDSHRDSIAIAVFNLVDAFMGGFASGILEKLSVLTTAVETIIGRMIDAFNRALEINSPSKRMMRIGESIVEGLTLGITANKNDIDGAFGGIRYLINNEIEYYKSVISSLKSKIASEKSKDNPNQEKINKWNEEMAVATKSQKDYEAALKAANKEMAAQRKAMIEETVLLKAKNKELEEATTTYNNLVSARQAAYDATKSQYSTLPELPDFTQEGWSIETYFDDIRDSTEANNTFMATLEELRQMGMDDTTYKKMLSEGVDAQPFLDSLKAAGPSAVAELNTIDAQLTSSATALAEQAKRDMYDVGVNAAKGLVDSLTTERDAIVTVINQLGDAIVKAIKKKLGIKSPSRVFAEVGKYSNEGLAKGLKDYSKISSGEASKVGENAVTAMQDSMNDISHLDFDIDTNPVITPVLDLDQFQKDAVGIDKMLAPAGIAPSTAATAARAISNMDSVFASMMAAMGPPSTTVEYNQYNNSPKALSNAEIYRQTRNQLAVLKGVLQS